MNSVRAFLVVESVGVRPFWRYLLIPSRRRSADRSHSAVSWRSSCRVNSCWNCWSPLVWKKTSTGWGGRQARNGWGFAAVRASHTSTGWSPARPSVNMSDSTRAAWLSLDAGFWVVVVFTVRHRHYRWCRRLRRWLLRLVTRRWRSLRRVGVVGLGRGRLGGRLRLRR